MKVLGVGLRVTLLDSFYENTKTVLLSVSVVKFYTGRAKGIVSGLEVPLLDMVSEKDGPL